MSQNRIGLQRIHDFAPRHERPQRHAAAERLGQAYDIGRNAVFEHGEQFARAAHAGLYLVEDQQGAHLVAPPPQGLQIARWGGVRTPASPCTGSASTQAVRRVMRFSASKSLNSIACTSGSRGRKAPFHSSPSGAPIMLIEPWVEPW